MLDVLNLAMRSLHILAAVTAVGGTIFARFVVLPTLDDLPPEERKALHDRLRMRWSKIVAASIGFLLLSGLYNTTILEVNYKIPPLYHALFGVKFLLAFVIFAVASMLSGRTDLAAKLRTNARFWLNLNIALAVIVVCLSSYLRSTHMKGLPERNPPPAVAPAVDMH